MPKVRPSDDLVTVPAAAKEIGKTKMTLYRWIARGKVHSIKLFGIIFISREEVERLKEVKSG